MESWKLSCLCLFYLSAAFDIIDHNILITRLWFWFGFNINSCHSPINSTSQLDFLHNLITVQSTGRTRSSSLVTLARPSVSSSLQITNRSFTYASPLYLWNQLPFSFRQPHFVHSFPVHLILRISPEHSHHLRSHHLSLPRPFTPDLKLNSFSLIILSSIVFLFPLDCLRGSWTCTGLSGHRRLLQPLWNAVILLHWRHTLFAMLGT